jgi:hypothetical protein
MKEAFYGEILPPIKQKQKPKDLRLQILLMNLTHHTNEGNTYNIFMAEPQDYHSDDFGERMAEYAAEAVVFAGFVIVLGMCELAKNLRSKTHKMDEAAGGRPLK